MTNGDKIRNLSNEELFKIEGICPSQLGERIPETFEAFSCPEEYDTLESCEKCCLAWLAQEG